MYQFTQALNVLIPLVYGISLGLYITYFLINNPTLGKLASRFLLLGILLHIMFFGSKWAHFKYFPIADSFASLSMLALSIALIYYILEKIVKEGKTGIFFLSITFMFQLISSMFIRSGPITNQLLLDPKFGIHTTFTLLGISSLAISALYGLMYIMLAKEIKSHRFSAIYDGLPSLETIETMARNATAVGIILLGFGIFMGHLWAYKVLGYFFKPDPKIIATDIAWLVYIAGWIIVKIKNLHGLRIRIISFVGFLLFFVTIILINFLSATFHKFI